jgi:hypothetical protein
MDTVVITTGPHEANVTSSATGRFAHRYVGEPEGHEPEATWFLRMASAFGGEPPYVLIFPDLPEDPERAERVRCEVCDWIQIVESATNSKVTVA